MKFRRLIGIAGAFAAAGLMSSAQAALVTSWDYEVLTEFNGNNTFEASGGGTQIQTARQVSWGDAGGNVFVTNDGRSGITINDTVGDGSEDTTVGPNIGNVVTNDLTTNIGRGAWITHHNNPISAATLLTSEIDSTLALWAFPPGDTGGPPSTGPTLLTFTIYFAETSNGANPCADGTANNQGVNINGCSDIFALNQAQAFNQQFTFDSGDGILETYFVSIFPIVGQGLGSFTLLSDDACEAAGADLNCIGFQTIEEENTTIRFGFAVTAEPISIPEPGTLALLGGSLFGLAAFRRRRMS
jgi:hypothetical protein